jgi:hypothetical protein
VVTQPVARSYSAPSPTFTGPPTDVSVISLRCCLLDVTHTVPIERHSFGTTHSASHIFRLISMESVHVRSCVKIRGRSFILLCGHGILAATHVCGFWVEMRYRNMRRDNLKHTDTQ